MKYKIYLPLIIVLLTADFSIAQDSYLSVNMHKSDTLENHSEVIKNKTLYVEGSFLLQSANFETNFYRSKSSTFQLNGRVGFGYFQIDFFGVTQSIGGILGLNFIIGRKNGHFDSSIGGFIGSDGSVFAWPIGTVGYRYQKPSGGFIFKTHIGTLGLDIGLGYSF